MEENTTAAGTATASDPDGDALSFSISGGDDRSLFRVDPATGAFAATTPLDFENPADADGDNVYEIVISVSDGTASSSATVNVTAANVPNDGVTRIVGAAMGDNLGTVLSSAPDYDGDTIGDLFVGTFKTSPTDPPTEGVSYLIFAAALATEDSRSLEMASLSVDDGVEFFVSDLPDLPGGTSFSQTGIVVGVAPPTATAGAFNLVSHPLDAIGASAVTGIFAVPDIKSAGGRIDLNASPLKAGLRSSRDNASSTFLGEILVAGDLNADTVTDIVAQFFDIERDNGGSIDRVKNDLLFISGLEMLQGAQGLFDVAQIAAGSAAVLTDETTDAGYMPLDATGDATGDGADDVLILSGDETNVTLLLVSGEAIFDDADGYVRFSDLGAPDIFTFSASEFASLDQRAATGDFDGDGKADVLLSGAIDGAPDQAAIIYNEGFVNDADGAVDLADVLGNQKVLIQFPSSQFTPIVGNAGDIDGGGADDVLLATGARDSGQSSIFIVVGEAIDKQSSDVVTLDPDSLGGEAVRILAPPLDGATSGTDGFGVAFAQVGDVDGDGIAELAIGASLSGSGAGFAERPGAVFVIPSTRLTSAIETGVSIDLGDYF